MKIDVTAELIQNVNVDALLNQREAVLERIEQAITILKEAQTIAEQAHLKILSFSMESIWTSERAITRRYCPEDCPKLAELMDEARQLIDASAWQYLMDASDLRLFMDEAAHDEWKEMLKPDHCPVLTRAQIETTFSRLHAAREEMFERSILDAFRRLSWNYITKQPVQLGKRLIVNDLLSTWGPNHMSFSGEMTRRLDELVRVLSVLEGKPDLSCHECIYHYLKQADFEGFCEWSGPYFSLRWYKKGTGHLTFSRADLVDKMNQIMLKHYPDASAAC
ncbi:conserved hypothetical protein [Candidatus Glomeribacter gigasporarum BEG34]|uniref:DUF4942 domain-containing protein n=1 Tax=Candidatus Glomeribacter gigasporarum BEG34 TaxID=1070319 RepID=G2JBB9_9BURK|nr:DUF4942 domain-containing protein [Candidatus Glomeribacter gigasporarum]CCD30073.1 conserved hypothetical protein [Candidatus Glomeribacter gigasporarum BEG34]